MENQPVSGYCLLKMENTNYIFLILQYVGNGKKVAWNYFKMYQGKEVVFILSTDTGEMLDYVIKCLVCHECSTHSKWDKKVKNIKLVGQTQGHLLH